MGKKGCLKMRERLFDLRTEIAVIGNKIVEAKGNKLSVGEHHEGIAALVKLVANRHGALETLKILQETR